MESQRTLTLWPYLGLLTCLLLSLLLPQFWDSDSLLDGNWQTQTQTLKLGDWESTFSRHSSRHLDDFVADRFQTVDALDPQAYFYHFPCFYNLALEVYAVWGGVKPSTSRAGGVGAGLLWTG